jgi:hypothetical protein
VVGDHVPVSLGVLWMVVMLAGVCGCVGVGVVVVVVQWKLGRCLCGVMESWGFGRGQRRVGGLGQAGCRCRCRCWCFKQRAMVNTAHVNCRQATVLCTSRRPWNRARNREQWSKSRITTGDGVSYSLWPARICGEGCASWAVARRYKDCTRSPRHHQGVAGPLPAAPRRV